MKSSPFYVLEIQKPTPEFAGRFPAFLPDGIDNTADRAIMGSQFHAEVRSLLVRLPDFKSGVGR
jgi:hypothetical protein